ncbi:MAG: pyrroloquinoline quinone-dependent dehydrogenase [Gammaproteobacteria bacterium]|nr:pyrroloquinoline quinone-dependent dehydrogenase [Gammaproteobacteria bacterium]
MRTARVFVILVLASLPAVAWQETGGEGGRHFSRLKQIHPGNVKQLELAWEYQHGDLERLSAARQLQTSFQVTPIKLPAAAGGHLAICTPLSRVVALNPATGAERWAYDPKIELGDARPILCRGVSYWEDESVAADQVCRHRLFLASYDRRLIALDSLSGELCREFGHEGIVDLHPADANYPRQEVTSPSPPAVVNGVLVVGSGVMDFAKARAPAGTVYALDAHSGRRRWSFQPLSVADQAVSGAANVWAPISVDAERDLIFLPTSAPSADYYGVERPGDNRHANSLVALRASTGKVVWSFQAVHHDLWDYDLPAQPILADIPWQGETVPAVIQLTKQGFIFALNRETGEPVWPIEERVVSGNGLPGDAVAPTQPWPTWVAPLLPQSLEPDQAWGFTPWDRGRCRDLLEGTRHEGLFTPITEDYTLLLPGSLGGPNWGGAAVDTRRQLLMVNYSTVPARARLVLRNPDDTAGSVAIEGYHWTMRMSGTPYDMEVGMLVSPFGVPCTPPPWGKLAALDLRTGKLRWDIALGSVHNMGPVSVPFHINWGTPTLGGGVATASGLLFIAATTDKTFRAYAVESGEMLWHASLPADGLATPMSYASGGRQFVVIAAGGHHMFAERARADSLMAFALPEVER